LKSILIFDRINFEDHQSGFNMAILSVIGTWKMLERLYREQI